MTVVADCASNSAAQPAANLYHVALQGAEVVNRPPAEKKFWRYVQSGETPHLVSVDDRTIVRLTTFAAFAKPASASRRGHQILDEVLRPIRNASGDSNWRPNFLEAMACQ